MAEVMDRETSLGKALRLLIAVGENGDSEGVSVSDLLRVTGLSRPTAYRFLSELESFGLVDAVPRQSTWRLGPKIVALAAVAGNWSNLRRRAKQEMEEFSRRVGQTVHLALIDGLEVVYIDKSESPAAVAISSAIGMRGPLYSTALGKCLVAFGADPKLAERVAQKGLKRITPSTITTQKAWLAAVEEVRRAGVAFDNEENVPGVRCVAAPIRDAQGYALAAISVSSLVSKTTAADLERLSQELRETARRIEFSAEGPA